MVGRGDAPTAQKPGGSHSDYLCGLGQVTASLHICCLHFSGTLAALKVCGWRIHHSISQMLKRASWVRISLWIGERWGVQRWAYGWGRRGRGLGGQLSAWVRVSFWGELPSSPLWLHSPSPKRTCLCSLDAVSSPESPPTRLPSAFPYKQISVALRSP